MDHIQIYIGYTAGILALIPYIFYIRAMRKGTTRPNLAGWFLYTVGMLMIVASSIALGAWQAVWLAVAYVIGNSIVIIISLKTGYFAFTKFDRALLFIAFFSLIIWMYTDNALYALVINVFVDAMGALAIANKLYKHPGTEDTTAWTFYFFIAVFNIFAVATFDLENALYPIYLVFGNGIIALLSLRRLPKNS